MAERLELAKLCSSRDWSKAIRVLDSLLSKSCLIQDICNRAFCYSQLELHKHVIKDCDKALKLDPALLQAYILKGHAFSALGRNEEALLVWEEGHKYAVHNCTDLKQLLELEQLLTVSKQNNTLSSQNHAAESDISANESVITSKSNENHDTNDKLNGKLEPHSETSMTLEVGNNSVDRSYKQNVPNGKVTGRRRTNGQSNGSFEGPKLSDGSEVCGGSNDLSKPVSPPFPVSSDGTGSGIKPSSNFNITSKGDVSEASTGSSDTSELSYQTSAATEKSMNKTDARNKPSDKIDMHLDLRDQNKRNKKFSVTRISKTKSINVDFRLSRGIAQVNEGKYNHAISIFDQILREDPTYPEALIGRGTAYAFQRELEAAIVDFTKAIQSNPSACEAWKRRGQARAALGESVEAIADLTKALEFEPNSPDVLHERGIVNFKFKDFKAAVEDLTTCVKIDRDNKSAYTYLGSALSSIGEHKRAEDAHKKSIELDKNFLEAWVHLTQLYQELANPDKALECLHQILQIDGRFAKAYHLRGLLLHGMGQHRNAIKDLSAGLSLDSTNIECLYLRASCYHAVGQYREAVKDYDAALDMELESMDKFVLQCLAFYQKEIALYTASKLSSEFCWFDIDGDINPLFKEFWCKRMHPKDVCEKVYRQPPLRDSLRKSKLKKQEFTFTKARTTLIDAADCIGKKIQYNCPGFLPNRRQHRMAGLAAIEIAQKVSKAWRVEWKSSNKSSSKNSKRARRKERLSPPSQNRGGAGCSTSSLADILTSSASLEDRSSSRSIMSWHELYSLAVKWRQISEPCDPVVWVNKLSEEFNSGFGSHTPLTLGQYKVVRYYPNCQRAINLAKAVIMEKKFVYSKEDNIIDLSREGRLENVKNARSCSDLHSAVGQDFWLATWCNSTASEGMRLEGTRITLLKMGESGYDFAIRTPCTPSRWNDFDTEMALAWEAVCNACCGETYGATDFDVLGNVRDAILRMTYYWYNFMPLSRGTAAVGFIVLLGVFLAANMEFTGTIPVGVQVDWEAILNFDPSSFMDSVKTWLYESLNISTSWKDYPDVASNFETTASVVAALSSYSEASANKLHVEGK
ncbi:hypothetical protein ACET3Z_011031 [Daucus carota]